MRPERNAMTPYKKPSIADNVSTKFSQHVKNGTLVVTRAPVALANYSSKVWRQSCLQTINVKLSSGGKPIVIAFSFSHLFDVE
jgi:hypothetical protein